MVFLARTAPQIVEACAVKDRIHRKSHRIERPVMTISNPGFELFYSDASDTADHAGKVFVDDFIGQTDCLKYPCRLIGLNCRNTHLGCNLHNAAKQGFVVIHDCRVLILVQKS